MKQETKKNMKEGFVLILESFLDSCESIYKYAVWILPILILMLKPALGMAVSIIILLGFWRFKNANK